MKKNHEKAELQALMDEVSKAIEMEAWCLGFNLRAAEENGSEIGHVKAKAALTALNNLRNSAGYIAGQFGLRYPHLPERELKLVVNNR